jgi:pimeloyl-ACP methyl ester carboxylesterase
MKNGWKITLITIAFMLLLVLVGPFLVPVPLLDNTQPVQSLADADSEFIEINGISVHYKRMGSGEPVFILLHGFGASTFSWREVMQPLSAYGRVIAYDRPAFGLTERPLEWVGKNPYTQESNIALLLGLMDAMEIQEAVLVGNSAGGTLATAFTLAHPERVLALIEVDAAVYQTIPNSPLLYWLFNTPQMDHLGPLISRRLGANAGEDFLESAWHDPSKLDSDPSIRAGYRVPLQAEDWDRALWQYTQAARAPDFIEKLDQINVPTLVITGDDDQIVFPEASRRLAEDIPGSVFKVIEDCGHLPHEECPKEFMQVVVNFLDSVLEVNHE